MLDGLVSTKGQVVIPKDLRDAFGIRPGSRIRFANENGRLVADVVANDTVPAMDVLLAQARQCVSPDESGFGDPAGVEAINDGWVAPVDAQEMDTEALLALWNTHAKAAKHG